MKGNVHVPFFGALAEIGTISLRRQMKRWEDNIKEWTGIGFGDSLWQRKTGKDRKVFLGLR